MGAAQATALSAHDLRRVAVAAGVDPRTVRARTLGKPMRSTTAARVDGALVALGFAALVPPSGLRSQGAPPEAA